MLSFYEKQFLSFRNHTLSADCETNFHTFPDGEERLILNTPNQDISFSFTEDEWADFAVALEEAIYMQSVYKLVYS